MLSRCTVTEIPLPGDFCWRQKRKGMCLGKQHSCLQDAAQQYAVETCRVHYSSWATKNSLNSFPAGCISLYLSSALLTVLKKLWTKREYTVKRLSLFRRKACPRERYGYWIGKGGSKGKRKTLQALFFDYTVHSRFKHHKFHPCSLNDSCLFFGKQ